MVNLVQAVHELGCDGCGHGLIREVSCVKRAKASHRFFHQTRDYLAFPSEEDSVAPGPFPDRKAAGLRRFDFHLGPH